MNNLNRISAYCLILSMCFFTACATLFTLPSQKVSFESIPSNAVVTVVDKESKPVFVGLTPTSTRLNREKDSFNVFFFKEGYLEKSDAIDTDINHVYFVNGLLPQIGVIGFAYDHWTGADRKYPEIVEATLEPGYDTPTFYSSVPPKKPSGKFYFEAGGGGGTGTLSGAGDGGIKIGRVFGNNKWIFAGQANFGRGDYTMFYLAPSIIYYPVTFIQLSATVGAGYMNSGYSEDFMGTFNASIALDFGLSNAALIGFKTFGGIYNENTFISYGPFVGYRYSQLGGSTKRR